MSRRAICIVALVALSLVAFSRTAVSARFQSPIPHQQTPATARFEFGGDAAEIPAQFIENLFFLPVRVNDSTPSLFEFDSGAPATSIDPARANMLNLSVEKAPANLAASSLAVLNGVLSLPGVDLPMNQLPVLAREGFSSEVGRVYEGTLGQDFLQRVVVQVDYGRKSVVVYDPGTFKYAGSGRSFPVMFAGGMPVVRAKFEFQKGGGREADFAVNTSLNTSVVMSDQFGQQRHLFLSHGRPIRTAIPQWNNGENVEIVRLKSFRLGPYEMENSIAAFSQRDFPSAQREKIAGEIGGGMLRHFTVVFDYPHRQLILAPNGNFADEDQEDKSGVSVVARGPNLRTFEVVQVQPGTPGAEAGVQKGDVIAGVDDDAAADLTLTDLRDLFRQIGHQYKLLIQRNGQTITLSIQMRRLL